MDRKITGLYYITHIENLRSILELGILSHRQVEDRGIQFTPIYDKAIVSNRKLKTTPEGKSLWDYANLFFEVRNPMLYRVISEKDKNSIIIVRVKQTILNQDKIFLANGNAAHSATEISPYDTQVLRDISKSIGLEYWQDIDGTKRKIMAECLVPEQVEPHFIDCIYTANESVSKTAKTIVNTINPKIDVIVEPRMFFKPDWLQSLTDKLSIAKGDMFFSQMQTLTISVNTVGVMGKGLAARSKYQFPDVYVQYQDLCKKKKLTIGKPALIKREASLMAQLTDYNYENGQATWFLLFPTKQHWREDSKLEYIETGMQWVQENYKAWGLKSLAMPALGCGLGGLDWKDVGPIICSTAGHFDIPVCVYLPAETNPDLKYLSREYLLR